MKNLILYLVNNDFNADKPSCTANPNKNPVCKIKYASITLNNRLKLTFIKA